VYVLQFVKSFTIYYLKCACPGIWISRVYDQELRLESLKIVSTTKNLIVKSILATRVEKENLF
jgi:hypothetical protein